MDQSKRASICQFNPFCNKINFTSDSTGEELNDNNNLFQSRYFFFQILLPIILVVGVLISIAMIFTAQRITVEMFKKRRRNTRINQSRSSMRSSTGTPTSRGLARAISSISSHIGSLPTYRQVMAQRRGEESPPSYGEVTKDNLPSGTSAKNSISNPQQPTADLNRQQTLPTTSNFKFLPETSLNGSDTNYSGSNSSSGSAGARLALNQARDEHVSITIDDIDELVNSISVSTSLNQQLNEINDETLITGREDMLNDVNGIQTIGATNQHHIVRVDSLSSLGSSSI